MYWLGRKNLLRQKGAQTKLLVTGTDHVFVRDKEPGDFVILDQHKLALAMVAQKLGQFLSIGFNFGF